MRFAPLLIGVLLLSACGQTAGPVKAICGITKPTFTEPELLSLSDRTLDGLDLYAERMDRGCKAALNKRTGFALFGL